MICSRRIDSKILTAGQSREMGRYEDADRGSLLGLGRGMIIEVFHMAGILHEV